MDLQTVLRKSNLADGSGKGKVYATLVRYNILTTEELALRMLTNASYFLVEDYARVAGVSKSTAYRRLKQLVQRGVIAESGSRRRTLYVKA